MKIVHAADLHLGFRQYGLKIRKQDFSDAFVRLIDDVIEISPDIFIISGDIFQVKKPSYDSMKTFQNGLSTLRGFNIDVKIVTGNHDDEGEVTLQNYFGIPTRDYHKDGVFIAGIDWSKDMIEQSFNVRLMKDCYNILMIHQGIVSLGGLLTDDDLNRLKHNGWNYLALGHIHTPYNWNNFAFNPGSIEYTSSLHWGQPGGYYVLDINDGKCNYEHVVTPRREVRKVTVQLDGRNDVLRILDVMKPWVGVMMEVTLTGDKRVGKNVLAEVMNNVNAPRVKFINNTAKKQSEIAGSVGTDDVVFSVFGDDDKVSEIIKHSKDTKKVIELL